jgi:hypothetical protein
VIEVSCPPDTTRAIEELEEAFPSRVAIEPGEDAGTIVRISETALGEGWSLRMGVLWFVLPFHYPDAAIYPYYVTAATPLGSNGALQAVTWRGMPVTQVSLRHSAWDPARDNAVGSVLLTQAWLRAS